MANNYLQFSFEINNISEECCEDIRALLSQEGEDEVSEEFLAVFPEYPEYEELGFQWELGESSLWIYTEESGNVEMVVAFLSAFLQWDGHENEALGFTYAETCDKPRVGEFGGGAVVVRLTEDGAAADYMNAYHWLSEQLG